MSRTKVEEQPMRARIKIIRLDEADEAVGLRFGMELDAMMVEASGGAMYYIVDAPNPLYGDYYIRAEQVAEVADVR